MNSKSTLGISESSAFFFLNLQLKQPVKKRGEGHLSIPRLFSATELSSKSKFGCTLELQNHSSDFNIALCFDLCYVFRPVFQTRICKWPRFFFSLLDITSGKSLPT